MQIKNIHLWGVILFLMFIFILMVYFIVDMAYDYDLENYKHKNFTNTHTCIPNYKASIEPQGGEEIWIMNWEQNSTS